MRLGARNDFDHQAGLLHGGPFDSVTRRHAPAEVAVALVTRADGELELLALRDAVTFPPHRDAGLRKERAHRAVRGTGERRRSLRRRA